MQDAVESHHEEHNNHRSLHESLSFRVQALDDQWNTAGDVLDEAFEIAPAMGAMSAAVHLSHLTHSHHPSSAGNDQQHVARDLSSSGSFGRAQTPLGTPADIGPVPEADDPVL